jgi:hypothetical protein
MNFEPTKYDYTLEEDTPPVTEPSPSLLSTSVIKRKSINIKQRQLSASSVVSTEEKKKEVTVLIDKENIERNVSLEETKEILRSQIRGPVDGKKKLLPEDFRIIQQSPFYKVDRSK